MPLEKENIYPALPATNRGQALVLGPDPKGKNFLYVVGNTVVIRDIENTASCDVYAQHSKDPSAAMYSPSGFYIASGDAAGKLRIWDTVNAEHILKYEYQPLSGKIKDICWSEDSKRIVVAGEGREKYANAFLWDSGSSTGEITGHSKSINSVDMRKSRPYRVITGSEDRTVGFYEGPPFKFKGTSKEHTNFVNAVRYAPDGSSYVSGGSDGKVIVYDGKTGDVIGELGSPKAHKGGIYAVCYSPDSKQVLTVSGDKTAKIFDVESRAEVTHFQIGNEVMDQQVGCLWSGDHILTVSLSGAINYLDPSNPSVPKKVLKGHNKSITSLAVSPDKKTVYTASFEGRICYWDSATGACDIVQGRGHTNQVQDMVVTEDTLISVGMDDTLRLTRCADHQFEGDGIGLDSQPSGCDAIGTLIVVACLEQLVIVRSGKIVHKLPLKYQASKVSIHPNQNEIAVGGAEDSLVHIYTLSDDTLTETENRLERLGGVTDVKYSPDGTYLAVADRKQRVALYTLPDYQEAGEWVKHTARITRIAWAPNSKYIVSGSLDTNLCVYNVDQKNKTILEKGAHPMNVINGLCWTDDNRLMSAGNDCCIRVWKVPSF